MHRYLSVISVTAVTTALIVVAVSKGIGSYATASASASNCLSRSTAADVMECLVMKRQICQRYLNDPQAGEIRNKEGIIGTDPLRTYEGCMADVQPLIDQLVDAKADAGAERAQRTQQRAAGATQARQQATMQRAQQRTQTRPAAPQRAQQRISLPQQRGGR